MVPDRQAELPAQPALVHSILCASTLGFGRNHVKITSLNFCTLKLPLENLKCSCASWPITAQVPLPYCLGRSDFVLVLYPCPSVAFVVFLVKTAMPLTLTTSLLVRALVASALAADTSLPLCFTTVYRSAAFTPDPPSRIWRMLTPAVFRLVVGQPPALQPGCGLLVLSICWLPRA